MKLLPRLAAALSSGVLFAFVSPPVNLAWAHWFMWLPVFWALRPNQHKLNAKLGYASGWLATFLLYFWLVETEVRFGGLPWVAGLAIQALYSTVFALPYILTFGAVHWFRQRLGLAWVFVLPALHVTLEKVGPQLFPYYQGVTQYKQPYVWQLASVISVMGVSYLVMLTNTTLAELVYRRREGRKAPWGLVAGVILAFVANLGFGAWRHDRLSAEIEAAPVLDVALLQLDVTMEERFEQSAIDGLKDWLDATQSVVSKRPDLVVWPEGAVAFNPNGDRKAQVLGNLSPDEFFSLMAVQGGYDFVIGGGTITRREEPDANGRRYEAYNSVYFFTDDHGLADRYDKMVPLPFGEYIPLSDTFPFLKGMIPGAGDFKKGKRPTRFHGLTDTGLAYTFTIPICYEAILERAMWPLFLAEDPQSEGSGPVDLFVNITNDAWFGDTASPHQHAMLTTVQAMHFGRPLLRLAYTGISWVVQPNGDILYETTPFTDVAEVVPLKLARTDTLYVRGGWFFPWLCVLATLGAYGLARRRPVAAA